MMHKDCLAAFILCFPKKAQMAMQTQKVLFIPQYILKTFHLAYSIPCMAYLILMGLKKYCKIKLSVNFNTYCTSVHAIRIW